MFNTDAFLVSNYFNILYLSGFETLSSHEREAYLLLWEDKKIILTDARYAGAKHNVQSELYIMKQGERIGEVIERFCREWKVKTLGFESDDLSWNEHQTLQKRGVELVPLSGAFTEIRSIKSDSEIFAIKQACHIGDAVLKDVIPYLHPAQTEKEIAWIIEKLIREAYSGQLAFNPIVAVDEHAAIPHYDTKNGNGVIKEGSLLLLDFGVNWKGYNSDITRMVGVGEVSDEIKKAYSHLLDAQQKTIEYARTSDRLRDIDSFCREELAKSNLPLYGHSTGHGVGLEVHESPRISSISQDEKKPGQVVTIEPGIYIPGKWGMRIEDTVTFCPQGEIEVLTRYPKALALV